MEVLQTNPPSMGVLIKDDERPSVVGVILLQGAHKSKDRIDLVVDEGKAGVRVITGVPGAGPPAAPAVGRVVAKIHVQYLSGEVHNGNIEMVEGTYSIHPEETFGEIVSWRAEGLVLKTNDNQVDVEVLLRFAQAAAQLFPGEKVLLAEYELRVTRYPHSDAGPWLNWRD